jgi:hypothetical protein
MSADLLREAADKMRADEDSRWIVVADLLDAIRVKAKEAESAPWPFTWPVEAEDMAVLALARVYLGHARQPDLRAGDAMGELHAFVGADDEERA